MKKPLTTFLIGSLLCLLFPITVSAYDWQLKDWDKTDTTMQILFLSALSIDHKQTREIPGNPYHEECGWAKNWIGRHPSKKKVDLYFLTSAVGHTAVSVILPKRWDVAGIDVPVRTIWQSFWFGVEVGTIGGNYYEWGILYEFK